jgi:hypothetical protein
MKQIIFLISLLLITNFMATAQTQRGSFLLGGSGRAVFPEKKQDPTRLSLGFSPQAGYFLFKNFALGIKPILSYTHYASVDYYDQKSTTVGISPFIRYYVGPSKLKLFFQGDLGYSHHHSILKISSFSSTSDPSGSSHYNSNGFFQDLGVGLVYFINEHVGLEGLFNYYHSSDNYSFADSNSESAKLFFNIGFQIYIPKAKKSEL